MKTMLVTISGDGTRAVCTLRYRLTDSPESGWTGDRRSFVYEGMMPDFSFPLEHLESVVAHQAGLFGFTYQIEDLGGEAEMWKDNIIF